MKKLILSAVAAFTFINANAQINVNKEDITTKVSMFEVWCFKKTFTNKECYFIDYGQDGFKPVNYDLKEKQTIRDKDGDKFEKGEWLKLVNYLESQGYEKDGERPETIGNVQGRIVTFKKKKV